MNSYERGTLSFNCKIKSGATNNLTAAPLTRRKLDADPQPAVQTGQGFRRRLNNGEVIVAQARQSYVGGRNNRTQNSLTLT